jgi:hypothetical protein
MSRRYAIARKPPEQSKQRPSTSDVDADWLALARVRMFRKLLDAMPPPPEMQNIEPASYTEFWEGFPPG